MTDDDDRREEPLLTYDQAEAEAIKEAMPMLRFIRDAEQKFGKDVALEVTEVFDSRIWDIAVEALERAGIEENWPEAKALYRTILAAKIKEETK